MHVWLLSSLIVAIWLLYLVYRIIMERVFSWQQQVLISAAIIQIYIYT